MGSIPAILDISGCFKFQPNNAQVLKFPNFGFAQRYSKKIKPSFLQPYAHLNPKPKYRPRFNKFVKTTPVKANPSPIMFTSPRFKLKVSRVLSLEKFRRLWKRRLSVLEYKAHHKLFVGSRVQKSSYKELLHQKSYTPFYQFSTPRSQAQSLRRQIPVLRSTAPTIFGTACSQFNSLGVITDHLFRAALALLNLPPVKLVTPFKKLITPTLYPVLAPVPNFASGRAPVKPSSAYAASYTQQSTGKYFTLLSHVQRLKAQTPKYKVLNKVLARSRTSMNLKRAAISIFTASSKVSWLSLKRALARMNLKHRHGFKRPRTFAYYSYSVPREFVYGKFTRRFIPELPFALRGTF